MGLVEKMERNEGNEVEWRLGQMVASLHCTVLRCAV